ncbi:MAG: hypothetical protein V8R16_01450 [Bacilli bacterium]
MVDEFLKNIVLNNNDLVAIKFIPEECYCKDLLYKGKIRFSSIKKYISNDNKLKYDLNEFAAADAGSKLLFFNEKLNKYEEILPSSELVGPIRAKTNYVVFCFYVCECNDLKNINATRIINDFGNNSSEIYGVLLNFEIFINKLTSFLKKKKYKFYHSIVIYEDINEKNRFNCLTNNLYCMFRKDAKFKYQREYRFVIESNKKHLDLELGDLKSFGQLIQLKQNEKCDLKTKK